MDALITALDKLSLDGIRLTDSEKMNASGAMESVEPPGIAADIQPAKRCPGVAAKDNEEADKKEFHTGLSGNVRLFKSEAGILNNARRISIAKGSQQYQKNHTEEAERVAVARYCFRGRIYLIYRHGPKEMCQYWMQKTELQNSEQIKQIRPVCSNIDSILDIRDETHLGRRYTDSNIQGIIGVAIPLNKASEYHSCKIDPKKGVCALIKWDNICEGDLTLFCGKESWMPRSAVCRMAPSKRKAAVQEKTQQAYVLQITRYTEWKERELQKRSKPLNSNRPKCGTQSPAQNDFTHEDSKTAGATPRLETPDGVADAAKSGGNITLPRKRIKTGHGITPDPQTEMNNALNMMTNLAKQGSFSYESHLKMEKAFKGINDELRFRHPEEYAARIHAMIATWPSYKRQMTARGFQEVGISPDEMIITYAKERVLAKDKFFFHPGEL
ncbi:hypothetical protein N7499_003522 [Penicillium canescens]|nr:hypothetical protein N7444_001966 [Penicillium canescens]KAJ6090808.1 hypothetical protein N7499_003522 [Penicillium canescens]